MKVYSNVTEQKTLADLLDQHLTAAKMGESRLATLVNEAVDIPQFLHRSTIRNWRIGTSKRVKDWRQLTTIAGVLHLNVAETDQLLASGKCLSLVELLEDAAEEDHKFLSQWDGKGAQPVQQSANVTIEEEPADDGELGGLFRDEVGEDSNDLASVSYRATAGTPLENPGSLTPGSLNPGPLNSAGLNSSGLNPASPTADEPASLLVADPPPVAAPPVSAPTMDGAQASPAVYPILEPERVQLPSVPLPGDLVPPRRAPDSRRRLLLVGLLGSLLVVLAFAFAREQIMGFVSSFSASGEEYRIVNGSFEDELTSWAMYVNNSADARFSVVDESLRIEILHQGEEDWHVQIFQPKLSVVAGKVYILRFRARGNGPNQLKVDVTRTDDPKTSIGVSGASRSTVTVSENWDTHIIEFEATETLTAEKGGARVLFDLGWVSPGTIWIDDVELLAR